MHYGELHTYCMQFDDVFVCYYVCTHVVCSIVLKNCLLDEFVIYHGVVACYGAVWCLSRPIIA